MKKLSVQLTNLNATEAAILVTNNERRPRRQANVEIFCGDKTIARDTAKALAEVIEADLIEK